MAALQMPDTCPLPNTKTIRVITSWDPNEKLGPAGVVPHGTVETPGFVGPLQTLPYKIAFENLETATAAAQEVLILDQLDSSLDWDSFALDAIEVGGRRVSIPESARSFKTEIDLRPDMAAIVEIDAHLNRATGRLECLFRGRDPLTGELADFLPPNSDAVAPRGEAWLSFSVKPKPSLSTGTIVRNRATIDFEVDVPPEPIETAEVLNTLDSVPPTSLVGALAAEQPTLFVVRWSGHDDAGGSGVQDYSLLVSDNGGPVAPWLTRTPETWGTLQGTLGHTYAFYSTAADRVGNRELLRSTPDTVVQVTSEGAELRVSRAGQGSGTVTSAPSGIDCGVDCAETYAPGTIVTLTEVSDAGSLFTGWSEGCSGTGTCQVTMDTAASVTATFSLALPTRALVVTKGGGGTGMVTSSPGGIDCGLDCAESYGDGASVTLTATASSGSTFGGWSGGGCTGAGPCKVVMDSDKSVTATFWSVGAFFAVTPCRLVDTRNPDGTYGGPALAAGADRVFPLFGQCDIPSTARAVSVNLTVTQPTTLGNLRLYPAGTPLPLVSSINYVAGQTRANNAIASLNGLGELAVRCSQASGTAHFVLDVNGFFE